MEPPKRIFGVPGPAPDEVEDPADRELFAVASRPMISRRAAIGGGLVGLGGLLLFPTQLMAKAAVPDEFVRRSAEGPLSDRWLTGPTSACPWWT